MVLGVLLLFPPLISVVVVVDVAVVVVVMRLLFHFCPFQCKQNKNFETECSKAPGRSAPTAATATVIATK